MAASRIVVKIGSHVITNPDGSVNVPWLRQLCQQVATLHGQSHELIIVSSGAVASGRSQVQWHKKADAVTQRQLLAAVGQTQLINTYTQLLVPHQLICAQVLVTKEDFRGRRHYLNIQHCLENMLHRRVIPIINENDVVSVTELMFTDNDELAGLVAAMVNADKLVILTNVAGIYDRPPHEPGAQLVAEAAADTDFSNMISTEKSDFGRGGMLTKVRMAQRTAAAGIGVHIVDGQQEGILLGIMQTPHPGTFFAPQKKITSIKRWISQAEGYVQGSVWVNEGAYTALTDDQQARSLLLVGITKVQGSFEKGDVVHLCTAQGQPFGIGRVQYNAAETSELLGLQGQKAAIHYDHLYLY